MEIEMTDTEKMFADDLSDEALDAPRIHGVNGVIGTVGTQGSVHGCTGTVGTVGTAVDKD
jgi:hypothetical protein